MRRRWWIGGIGIVLLGLGALVAYFALQPKLDTLQVPFVRGQAVPPPQQFMAGAATVDITPPPGYLPRAGYATWSTIGQGFRTRLYARVYYMRDVDGDSHLIVQTDLPSGSRVLHTKLGELLAKTTDIDASNLTLTATHTHSGPGQILGSQFYNKHISHVPGFAEDYFEFLVERISGAAQQAIRSQQPARLATGKLDVWGLTRNRSLAAYVENETVANKGAGDERTFHSVNPTLYMVRIDSRTAAGGYQPLGAFATFSIHGTALPSSETLFNADVWAYLHKDWEHFVITHYQPDQAVHVSAFEGTHGDVAPAASFEMLGFTEARRIGKSIAERAIELYQSLDAQLTDQVDLQSAVRYVNLRREHRIGDIEICEHAALGNTLAAAPLEHTSPVIGYLPFMKQGSRRSADDADTCQGRKRILGFSWLQPLLEPHDSFPDYVLFQLLQINNFVLVPLPFEMTTEAGRRVSHAVAQEYEALGLIPDIAVTSLAGGYTGYVTTPEEYGRQYYEGGHTLYGKNTLPYLAAQLSRLTRDLLVSAEPIRELPSDWTFRFQRTRFLPDPIVATGRRTQLDVPSFHHARINQEGYWIFRWQDVNPTQIELHRPLLSVETRTLGQDWEPLTIDGRPVNDEGYDLAVRVQSGINDEGMSDYAGFWYNPLFAGETREYRFVVSARKGQPVLYSLPFH